MRIELTEEKWVERFRPVLPLDFEGGLRPFSTEGVEGLFVALGVEPHYVWTLMGAEGARKIVPGFWPKRGEGAYVTVLPWEDGGEYVVELG
jgi:hypothetical protein